MNIFKLPTYKYEILLFALIQHLFIGVFLVDLNFYTRVIWPITIFILGLGSILIYTNSQRWKINIKNFLFAIVLFLPIGIPFFHGSMFYFLILNILYVIFFIFLFSEILKHLISPSYIDADLISAAACGYFILIEISVFLLQFFQYLNVASFKGINNTSPATTFIDLIYFCSVTFTSIGFGDITPNTHTAKLLTSFIGIVGQFYTVVLVGILISKFSSKQAQK